MSATYTLTVYTDMWTCNCPAPIPTPGPPPMSPEDIAIEVEHHVEYFNDAWSHEVQVVDQPIGPVRPWGMGGFVVDIPGGPFIVDHTEAFGWSIYDNDMDLVPTGEGSFAIGFPTAESAVDAVLVAAGVTT